MSDQSCTKCRFKGILLNADQRMLPVCRLRPPQVVGALVNSPNGPAWMTTTAWPAVGDNDWCSEYVPSIQMVGKPS